MCACVVRSCVRVQDTVSYRFINGAFGDDLGFGFTAAAAGAGAPSGSGTADCAAGCAGGRW